MPFTVTATGQQQLVTLIIDFFFTHDMFAFLNQSPSPLYLDAILQYVFLFFVCSVDLDINICVVFIISTFFSDRYSLLFEENIKGSVARLWNHFLHHDLLRDP